MKKIKHIIISILIAIFSIPPTSGKVYFKGDFMSSNMWTYMAGLGMTYAINKSYESFVFDNFLNANSLQDDDNLYAPSTFGNSFVGFHPRQLFNACGMGLKLGYISNNFGFFNWGIFGSLHYRYNIYSVGINTRTEAIDYGYNHVHRMQIGPGIILRLGKDDHPIKVEIIADLRYDIPIAFKGDLGKGTKCLNNGLSPYFSITIGGPHILKKIGFNLGLFMELSNYNLFKTSEYIPANVSTKIKGYGINFTWIPWKDHH